jgi:hypothetical protein
LNRAAAIGERTAFMPQANSTAWGREVRSGAAKPYSPLVPAQAGTQL